MKTVVAIMLLVSIWFVSGLSSSVKQAQQAQSNYNQRMELLLDQYK